MTSAHNAAIVTKYRVDGKWSPYIKLLVCDSDVLSSVQRHLPTVPKPFKTVLPQGDQVSNRGGTLLPNHNGHFIVHFNIL